MRKILILVLFLVLISCSVKKQGKPDLVLMGKYKIEVPEPSGLTLTDGGKKLWTVSDENSSVYLLDCEGNKINSFKVNYSDLEGITELKDGRLALVVEWKRKIVFIDTLGRELKNLVLNVGGEYNKGLEGITFNTENNHLFVANEKYPAMLIELDENFNVVMEKEIDFASDLSGLFYEKNENVLWMVSDESNIIAKTDLKGNLIESWNLSLKQIEGIAVDYNSQSVYLVSDAESKLYHFKLIK